MVKKDIHQRETSDAYQKYIEKKHSTFSVDPDVVKNVVYKATGRGLIESKRIIAGEVNEVYDVATSSGNIIVRISHAEENRFGSEKWAIDESRGVRVPAPKVLFIGQADNNGKTVYLSVERKLPGISLSELLMQSDDQVEIKNLTEKAGEILAKIHSVKTEKYGSLGEGGVGNYDSWKSFMHHPLGEEQRQGLLDVFGKIDISKNTMNSVFRILEEHSTIYQTVKPRLLHGDFGPKHILVDNGKISGIIDFENAKSGDPVYDFSWWSYFEKNRPPTEWLLNGYQKISKLPDDYELRLRLGRLRLGTDLLWYYTEEHHELGLKRVKINFIEDLKYFKNI